MWLESEMFEVHEADVETVIDRLTPICSTAIGDVLDGLVQLESVVELGSCDLLAVIKETVGDLVVTYTGGLSGFHPCAETVEEAHQL